MNPALDVIINQILRQPAIVMGFVILIGNVALKNSVRDTLVATIKAMVGMLILAVGSSTLVGASRPLMQSIFDRFGVTGVIIDPWTMVGEIEGGILPSEVMGLIGVAMTLGLLLCVVLARITPIKTIYLTGHKAYADTVTMLFLVWFSTGTTGAPLLIVTVGFLLVYWWLATWMFRPISRTVVGDAPITVGHNLLFGTFLATLLARLFKPDPKKNPSCEELKLPGFLSVFSDAVIGYSIIMGLMFFAIAVIVGPTYMGALSGAQNFLLFGFMQGLQVAVGMTILLMGVRMFLAELMPAFKGIADKIVPGATAAIDTPAFWSYAPTATLVGFLSTSVGMFIGTGLLIAFNSPVVAFPSIIPMFFGGSTMGVFCNAKGGWKGTVFGCFILGLILPLVSAYFASWVGTSVGIQGHTDWGALWSPIFRVLRFITGGA
ncbi:MAG: hypothetical protein FWB91_10910 [Defluviitaleaceae bacterium]|nr:hypothetical protein [Defluviitaleaceae bacterium]